MTGARAGDGLAPPAPQPFAFLFKCNEDFAQYSRQLSPGSRLAHGNLSSN